MIFFSKEKEETKKDGKKNLSRNERLEKGQLHCRIVIEMLGKPKSHLEKTFEQLIGKLAKEEKATITKKVFSKTKAQEAMFSRFAEIEVWVESLSVLVWLCFDYMPSSIEILEPDKILFENNKLTSIMNELQAKLHHVDMVAKNASTEKAILASNFRKLMENSIILSIAAGQKTKSQMASVIGVSEANLENALKSLLEQKKIKAEGDKYAIA